MIEALGDVMDAWVPFGPHRYRIAGELVFVETGGPFLVEHVGVLIDLLKRLDEAQTALGLIVDVRGGIQLPPDTRRAMAAQSDPNARPVPMLIRGASPTIRTLLTLLLNGMRLILRMSIPIRFCRDSDYEHALAWLHETVQARAQSEAAIRAKGAAPSTNTGAPQ